MISPLRRQLPAYSPLAFEAVWAGLRGLGRESTSTRASVSQALCEQFDARSALLVGSGTMGLRLALEAARATARGRTIALPAYSCYDIASAATGADARVLLYDVDPETLGPDEYSLRRVLEDAPAAIVGAHMYGYPIQVDRFAKFARDAGVIFIEDAAQSADGSIDGVPLGSFGSVSVLSFGRGKGRTAGCGGALLAHDEEGEALVAWAAKRLSPAQRGGRDAMLLAAQWALGRPSFYALPAAIPFLHLGETVYHPPRVPKAMSGCSLHSLSVALRGEGLEVERRRTVARRLMETARHSQRVDVIEPAVRSTPGYLRLPLRSKEPLSALDASAMRRHGFARAYPRPLHSLEPFRHRVLNAEEAFPGAGLLAERLFTLPTHSRVDAADLAAVEAWLLARRNDASTPVTPVLT